MLKLNTPFLLDKGIRTPLAYLVKAGLTHLTAKKLLTGQPVKISLSTLTYICVDLNCTPNDIFQFDNTQQSLPENHSLKNLVKVSDQNLLQTLKSITPDKLAELKKMIQ